jgi:hypothetical protein
MVGLNSELNRELTWRGLPVDRRGTPMRRFWDRRGIENPHAPTEDIEPIAGWSYTSNLDDQLGGAPHQLVLLIRSDLLRRYPNTAIYAVKAKAGKEGAHELEDETVAGNVAEPLFHALLPPDIRVFIFEEPTPTEAIGADGGPGWFFVLQEQASETRFACQPHGTRSYWTTETLTREAAKTLAASASSANVADQVRMPPVRCAIYAPALLPAPTQGASG